MPELVEQMYCSQQIVVPPKFPYILKRYCKAAIKTQPYDLLRWSYEYFKALALRKAPPVKLRLEYPVYSTEGGLTKGCLKVLANQLEGMNVIPLPELRAAWQSFCLDPVELKRVLCLCEVYLRAETVPFLHFIAVTGGLLTRSLTHTMILLCETLTKEPDGGSAAIPVLDFLKMYKILARLDAAADVKYINGYREGFTPEAESPHAEEESTPSIQSPQETSFDDFWQDSSAELHKVTLINDNVATSSTISHKLKMPILGKIERSPSIERAARIERETYLMERRERPEPDVEAEKKMREMSAAKFSPEDAMKDIMKLPKEESKEAPIEKKKREIEIFVFDEDNKPVPLEFYGEQDDIIYEDEELYEYGDPAAAKSVIEPSAAKSVVSAKSVTAAKSQIAAKSVVAAKSVIGDAVSAKSVLTTKSTISAKSVKSQRMDEDMFLAEGNEFLTALFQNRKKLRKELSETFDEIADIVDRYKSANYDLGMVAGRQMSTTSGEFIVAQIEKEIMAYIDEQIAILPDPDLKKKKAKPEEVAMIRDLFEQWLDENMHIIVPELEELEEEEEDVPDIILVYGVPGIGPVVEEEIIRELEEYALEVSKVQADVMMPRNIRHFMCPPLERFVEYNYDEPVKKKKREEVVIGGVITD